MKWRKLIYIFYMFMTATCFPLFYLTSQEHHSLTTKEELELYDYRLHPQSYHHPERYKYREYLIQLKDSSIWSVHPDYMNICRSWKKSHQLFIQPHYSCFWPDALIVYRYVLYNLDEDTDIPVYLEKIENSVFLIEAVNATTHTILLNNKAIWRIDDQADLSNWKEGQRILVGVNNEWHNAHYPQILINGDLDDHPYVSAIFLNNDEL
jgi:hypothetical protein